MEIKVNEQKRKDVEQALKTIKKDYGDNSAGFYGEIGKDVQIERFSSGLISLDIALGGGLPKGDFIEIQGKPSMGKTTLCIAIMAQVFRMGELTGLIDVEQDFDPLWAMKNGISEQMMNEQLIISQPPTLEEALTIAEGLIKSGAVPLVIVDSLAALTPESMVDKPLSKDAMGLRAAKMSQWIDKVKYYVKRSGTLVIFTNQHRDSMGMFTAAESPGGWAAKHAFGVRMNVWRANEDLRKDGDEVWGAISNIFIKKNKVGKPYKTAKFLIDFENGVSRSFDLLQIATDMGIVEKRGAWYSYNGDNIGQGEANSVRKLDEDPALFNEIDRATREAAGIVVAS